MVAKMRSQTDYKKALECIWQRTGARETRPRSAHRSKLVLDVEIWQAKHRL